MKSSKPRSVLFKYLLRFTALNKQEEVKNDGVWSIWMEKEKGRELRKCTSPIFVKPPWDINFGHKRV